MFQKIVSQISFSPATVEQLSDYANVLKRRQRISGWSLVIVSLLLVLQSIITLLPPISTQPSIDQPVDDFISGLYEESPATSSPSFLSHINTFASELPSINNALITSFYGLCLIVNVLTYVSIRLRIKEIRIIRTQLNTGGL